MHGWTDPAARISSSLFLFSLPQVSPPKGRTGPADFLHHLKQKEKEKEEAKLVSDASGFG